MSTCTYEAKSEVRSPTDEVAQLDQTPGVFLFNQQHDSHSSSRLAGAPSNGEIEASDG